MNYSNDNCLKTKKELDNMKEALTKTLREALKVLDIDILSDHNTKQTAERIAKMWIDEKFKGRYQKAPKITVFPNVKNVQQLMTIGPINLKSTCSHHFVDFIGKCWIGILPGQKLIGLSKYARIVDWFARRPQIQEELTAQITSWIETHLKPRGVAVVIEAQHFCCCTRGVEDEHMKFVTAEIKGEFLTDPSLKNEFYKQISFTREN